MQHKIRYVAVEFHVGPFVFKHRLNLSNDPAGYLENKYPISDTGGTDQRPRSPTKVSTDEKDET